MWEIGNFVRLHTSDEWDELVGIIDRIYGDTLAIFCVQMPCYRYYVRIDEATRVLERYR